MSSCEIKPFLIRTPPVLQLHTPVLPVPPTSATPLLPSLPGSIAAADINWHNLALSHELTGGLICNAVLSALSLALKECSGPSDQPILTEQTLTLGAKLQLRGLLEMVDFEHRVIPTFGVRDLVLAEDIQKQLQLILNAGKTHKFISAQWGFGGGENVAHTSGIMCLISGGPGVGKTAIARAIAYELGQPIKVSVCVCMFNLALSDFLGLNFAHINLI